VVVVTRYFGGTKLGTGGLVRAYGDAVRTVLAEVPRAEKVPTHTVMLAVPYNLFEQSRLLIAAHGGRILDETFAADVTLTAQLRVEFFPSFADALRDLSQGKLEAEVIETNQDTIMLVDSLGDEPAGN
jgi:putative IMPACT (imprinted ancient) family translation regulator